MNCFAMVDLSLPFRQDIRMVIASHSQARQQATPPFVEHPQMNVPSPYGHLEGVAALLARLDPSAGYQSSIRKPHAQGWEQRCFVKS